MVEAKTHLQRPSLQAIGRWLNRCGDGRDRGLQRPGTGADDAVWEVAAGAGGEQVQLPRFLPSPLQIKADDTERWANQSPKGESHTVTPLGGEAPPELILIEPQARGPPKLVANPAVLFVAGGKVYGGQGYANSGVLSQGFPEFYEGFERPQIHELTFDAPASTGTAARSTPATRTIRRAWSARSPSPRGKKRLLERGEHLLRLAGLVPAARTSSSTGRRRVLSH